MNRKTLNVVAGGALLVGGLAAFYTSHSSRTYRWDGQPLDHWFNLNWNSSSNYSRAHDAFQGTGSNAVPFLADKLLLRTWRPEPSWTAWLRTRTWIPAARRAEWFPRQLEADQCQDRALDYLVRLGPAAEKTQPLLIDLLESISYRELATSAPGGGRPQPTVQEVTILLATNGHRLTMTRSGSWFVNQLVRALAASQPPDDRAVRAMVSVVERVPPAEAWVRPSLLAPGMSRAIDQSVPVLIAALDHTNASIRSIARGTLAHTLTRHARKFSPARSTTRALDFARDQQLPTSRLVGEWVTDLTFANSVNNNPVSEALVALALESRSITEQIAGALEARGEPVRAKILRAGCHFAPGAEGPDRDSPPVPAELPSPSRPQPVLHLPALVVQLAVGNDGAAFAAASRFGHAGPRAAFTVPALQDALAHPNERVAARVTESLGQIGPEAREALPALRAGLTNESWMVRAAATNAVRLIEQPAP